MSVPARIGLFLRALAAAALLAATASPGADEGREAALKRSDLEEVKRRIRDLQKEIAETEESRSGAARAVAEAERAVSRVQRRLRELAKERAEIEKAMTLLEAERGAVEARIGSRQAELAEWVRRYYMHGAGDNLAPLLAARDPSQLARDAHYLEHLGRARLAVIEALRSVLREKARLAESIAARRDRLALLEAEQKRERDSLEAVQAERKRVLAGLSERLKGQQQAVQSLQRDEERLGRLIEALARQAAERRAAAERAAAARAAAERAAAERAARASTPPRRESTAGTGRTSGPRSDPVVGEVRVTAGPTPTGVSFSQLRGKLRFPVRGELVGRFGAPRAEGGTTWRGVFIRAAGGAEVRAVAAGEVVYSDWLRGYGNLIIVDHGDDYLSVYGNNDALFREVGEAIAGGEAIASVGASGVGPESGLYFEIRYRGQPVDPLQWVRLN